MRENDVLDRASRWFGVVKATEAAEQALTLLAELVDRLEELHPTLMDRSVSTVTPAGRGGLEIHIGHLRDENAEVDVFVSDRDALITWLTADIRVAGIADPDGRPWPATAADYVAAVLSGQFEVHVTSRGRWTASTKIVDTGRPPRIFSATGTFFVSWLPGLGRRQTSREHLDYGTRKT